MGGGGVGGEELCAVDKGNMVTENASLFSYIDALCLFIRTYLDKNTTISIITLTSVDIKFSGLKDAFIPHMGVLSTILFCACKH